MNLREIHEEQKYQTELDDIIEESVDESISVKGKMVDSVCQTDITMDDIRELLEQTLRKKVQEAMEITKNKKSG